MPRRPPRSRWPPRRAPRRRAAVAARSHGLPAEDDSGRGAEDGDVGARISFVDNEIRGGALLDSWFAEPFASTPRAGREGFDRGEARGDELGRLVGHEPVRKAAAGIGAE